jgi:eukaryotic-like serine/threonine-protein kinase
VHLSRQVAIKTLPRVAPHLAVRLRREARAMAAVHHPNLALIYGVEFYHGVPLLVCEFLQGGTLEDRLHQGPLSWRSAIELGLTLAGVIDRIHTTGILHRDIKPSNVGYTSEGVPKLLDFGLARTVAAGWDEATSSATAITDSWSVVGSETKADSGTATGVLVGTAAYLSPEAVAGTKPDPSFDLWSTCLVLYESIAGTNPLEGDTVAATLANVTALDIPDIRTFAPECPAPLADLLRDELHSDRQRRAGSGEMLGRRIEAVRARVS